MSILSGLFLQPRAIVTPPQVATAPVPVAPTPNPAPTAVTPQASPYNPLANGEIAIGAQYAHRSAGNNRFDDHTGPGLDISVLYPRFNLGRNFSFSPGLYFNRSHVETTIPAEFGPSTTSYANFTSAGIQAYVGWNPSPRFFEAGAALRLGVVNASSEGTADGLRGLRYSNLVFPSGVNATTFDATLALRVGAPRMIDSAAFGMGLFLNASVGIPGTNNFDMLPGYDTTTSHDSAIGVDTSPWTLGASVVFRLGRTATPRAVTPEAGSTHVAAIATAPVAIAPIHAGTTPPVAVVPVATTQVSAATYTDTVNFRLAASARRAATNAAVVNGMNASAIDANLLPNGTSATFTLSYTNERNGNLQFNSFGRVNADSSRTNWSAPFNALPITSQQVRELMEGIKEAGLPRHSRTARNTPIHLTVSRAANGTISLSSY